MPSELEALVVRRRQLMDMLKAEKNRLALANKRVRSGIKHHVKWREKRLAETEGELQTFIQARMLRFGAKRLVTVAKSLASDGALKAEEAARIETAALEDDRFRQTERRTP